MSQTTRQVTWLYIVNTGLLTTHEVDSAFWHEWTLFRMPGGIQLFLVLNLVLALVVLFGLRQVVLWQRGAKAFSLVLAAAGVFAFVIHTTFIALGHPEFRTPVSLTILAATLLVSLAQAAVTIRCPKPSSLNEPIGS